jgi:hypothetical protein
MLDGARGAPAVGRAMIADLLVAVSDFAVAHPEIAEIDFNPIIARTDSYDIVDARMILASC